MLSSRPQGAANGMRSSGLYEERLDEAMERRREEVRQRIRQFMADEGVTSVSDYGTV